MELIVVGTRPNFVKASLIEPNGFILINTGQHYDYELAQNFFDELLLKEPTYNLGIRSSSIADIIPALVKSIKTANRKYDIAGVTVIGDCNSTLAGALAASRLKLPLTHIEAGMRSGDTTMPEEINRIATDHLSTQLVPPTPTAVSNLIRENVKGFIQRPRNYVLDVLKLHSPPIKKGDYGVLTVHRIANAENKERLCNIFDAIGSADFNFYLPIHPRTKNSIRRFGITLPKNIKETGALPYKRFLELEAGSRVVVTDSGGVQVEADYLGKPCIVLRPSTEWVETLQRKAVLVDADKAMIKRHLTMV